MEAALRSHIEGLPGRDLAAQNIQSRIRGVYMMALANARPWSIVLTTGNKSELATGYATLYGDMAGGFAVLKDVPKTLVWRLARWRNQAREVIPPRVIDKPPSAELKPGQRDEDSLPPYEVLDPILEAYVEEDRSVAEIVAMGFDRQTVTEVVRMVDRNEYKRRQAPPGPKVTSKAFGRDRRLPITNRFVEA
jgi:NAD+ synthase (glutamine-hydrolysing)